jgi:hypothetical protein
VLERADVRAEYSSWLRAREKGDWGTSPTRHADVLVGRRPAGVAQGHGNISLARFAAEHASYFERVSAAPEGCG